MSNVAPDALANTRRTVQSYEGYAREYDALCGPVFSPDVEDGLRRLMSLLTQGGTVLEVGSGPGREADFLENLGAVVRRTDATKAFIEIQAERGKRAELLNVVTDDLGGPYDAVMALCVLIHVDRGQIDAVLRKVHGALRPGGAFLVSMRTGEGETCGNFHTVYWTRDQFAASLTAAGLSIAWDALSVGADGDEWVTFLARRDQ